MFSPSTLVDGCPPWHLTCGPSSANDSDGLLDHIPHALHNGSPNVLLTMEAKPNWQPDTLNFVMPYSLTNFLVLAIPWYSLLQAHSMDIVARYRAACAARRLQPLHIWPCSFQCLRILSRVSFPRFQFGPCVELKEQPAVHGEEFHKWQF